MIEKAATLNRHIHTSLNGKRLLSSSSSSSSSPRPCSSSTQCETDFTKTEMLESLFNEIAGKESKNAVNMKDFSSVYSAINGEMSSAMMIRDDQVEPDVESFRCYYVSCDVRIRDKTRSTWI